MGSCLGHGKAGVRGKFHLFNHEELFIIIEDEELDLAQPRCSSAYILSGLGRNVTAEPVSLRSPTSQADANNGEKEKKVFPLLLI